MSAADAIFPSVLDTVRYCSLLVISWPLMVIYIPITAPMHNALISQLANSKSHLLKTFWDALYSASFFSRRCTRSSGLFPFSSGLDDGDV